MRNPRNGKDFYFATNCILWQCLHASHPIFTSYGTQLFTPFSNHRFALNGVGIIDPFYSLILIMALAAGLLFPSSRRFVTARYTASAALILSTAYLFYGLWLNTQAERIAREQLLTQGFQDARVRCYPTVLQPFLRRVVARSGNEIFVGTLSMWGPGPLKGQRVTVPEHPLIQKVLDTREGRIFTWFSLGQIVPRITPIRQGFQVEIDDLRYGYFGPPDQGLWGIRARFDGRGRLQGAVERFNRPFPDIRSSWLRLWHETFGGSG